MTEAEVKKLKVGTPVKVTYRKFPYIGKYHCINWDVDGHVACVNFANEYVEVPFKWLSPISGLTQTKGKK